MRPSTRSKVTFAILAALALGAAGRAVTRERLAYAGFVAPAAMSLPNYLEPTDDEAFGTPVVRVTKPGDLGSGVTCHDAYCSHRYSSAQAWNADESLLVLSNGCGGLCFLDGQTYAPLFHRDQSAQCEWNPREADAMICVGAQSVFVWRPRSDQARELFAQPGYSELGFGPYKGNPSDDGRRIAVRAKHGDDLVVFGLDVTDGRKFPDISLSRLPGTNNSCTISPLGERILCFQDLTDETERTYIFSVYGRLLSSWPENHRPGHGDLTIDDDGSEIYVGVSKSPPDEYQVIKRRLDDGKVTSLLAYGEAQHVSLRAIRRPGWAIVSYGGDPADVSSHDGWAPYSREVIAVRLDGSQQVRRIAQTHNVRADYWSETHASPSPGGTQVIWSSNWGVAGGPVYEFVTQVNWPLFPLPKGGITNALN